jgi:hypothetical protein
MGQPEANPVPKPHSRFTTDGGMLQLRSGAHVAGFLPGKAYLVSQGHALTVEFLGTPGVMPRMLAEQETAASEAYFSQRVLYEDLWPGISLTFGLAPKGDCEATYVLATGADVAKIRLRYNVPVKLQEDGTLKFQFSTDSVTESAPEAWQEIKGKRASVTVSFTLVRGEVGFAVGSYDPRFPLTIDPKYSGVRCRVSGVRPRFLAGFAYFASWRVTPCQCTRLIHTFRGLYFRIEPGA